MWYETRTGERKPFRARWRLSGGAKTGAAFESPDLRAKFAEKWQRDRALMGRTVTYVDAATLAMWTKFKQLTNGENPLVVAEEWAKMKNGLGPSAITVSEAVEKYLAFRQAGKMSTDMWAHFRKSLRDRFVDRFGKMALRDVTDDAISEWLQGLKHPRTNEPLDPTTVRDHRKHVNTFMEYASRVKRWIARNPCDGVPIPEKEEVDVVLLTPDEGHRLFSANERNPVVGRLALEAFGFLRASSAARLRRADVADDIRGLRLRGAEHKSGKTKFRQGHADNLWPWILRAPDETWEMSPRQYAREKALAFRVAGIMDGSNNRLRKTCISAHLAAFKNPPLTSHLAQHRNGTTTEIYVGVMSEADGRAWFGIHPKFIAES